MWHITADGSVLDESGKVIFFSTDRFVKDICLGNCCFICGANPSEKPFNNDHVLPEWLLRRYELFSRAITLPNGASVRYDRYTVPCCRECNTLMGDVIEAPISEVMRGGANAINRYVSDGYLLNMFVWMGLIFLKTHLKDRVHRFHLDSRKGEAKIADDYDWEYLHHIHSVVRCFYNNCTVEPEVLGSFLSVPVRALDTADRFDFGDLYVPQTMLLRLDDVALFAVFNDSSGTMNYFTQKLRKITGPLSGLQLREVMVELAYLNIHLKNRPTFHSEIDVLDETYRIVATRPHLDLSDERREVRGALLYGAVQHALPRLQFVRQSHDEVVAAIKAGNFSFLFSDSGEFISDSIIPMPPG